MSPTSPRRLAVALLGFGLALWGLGCTEKITPPDVTPPGPTSYVMPDSIQGIFTDNCTTCHFGQSPPAGLDLTAAHSYDLLVDVHSLNCTADLGTPIARVRPGVPDSSCLYIAITTGLNDWGQMPLGGPTLPADTVAKIRRWIQNGAPGVPVVSLVYP